MLKFESDDDAAGPELDPEGRWPIKVDDGALPIGVDARNWDFETKGPIPCVVNFYLKDILNVDTVGQTFQVRKPPRP